MTQPSLPQGAPARQFEPAFGHDFNNMAVSRLRLAALAAHLASAGAIGPNADLALIAERLASARQMDARRPMA